MIKFTNIYFDTQIDNVINRCLDAQIDIKFANRYIDTQIYSLDMQKYLDIQIDA